MEQSPTTEKAGTTFKLTVRGKVFTGTWETINKEKLVLYVDPLPVEVQANQICGARTAPQPWFSKKQMTDPYD